MSDRGSPQLDALPPVPDQWDVVVKVKFGNTLKRFNGFVDGAYFTLNLSALRSKIASAFKFGPDTDFVLIYTDEDGDVVMLDDDEDLHDAAINQKLNPLRIDVQMKNIPTGTSQTNHHETNTVPLRTAAQEDSLSLIKSVIDEAVKPLRSTARDDPLAHLKSAIGEVIKSIHDPVPESLAKLSREALDAAPPQLTELIKPFVDLITSSNNSLSSAHSPGSSGGMLQTQVGLKGNDEPKVEASFGSKSLNTRNIESSKTAGVKSVLAEAPVTPSSEASQGQQASIYPSVEDLLFASSGGNNSASKGLSDAQSKGKSVMPSAVPLPPPVVPTFRASPPVSSTNDWSQSRRWVDEWSQPRSIWWQPEADAKAASDSRWRIPMYRAPHMSPQVPHAPPPPRFPYPGQLLSSGRQYGDLGIKVESSPAHTSHRWIQCDGCGVQPIVGPRYKSNVKENYDLCAACLRRMGNDEQYTRIDKPISPHKLSRHPLCRRIHSPQRPLTKSKRDKLESRFILDVTVLDGTLLSPSTPFIKIWRIHNNGSVVWPLGTHLIWVGGDQFAVQTFVPLEIPVNGFPVDKEIDVAVDFLAPARPGRYISYWRLASPSGQKFGQRVWVHIQVEDLSFANDNRNAAINFNLPPGSNGRDTHDLIDVNIEPVNQDFSEHANSSKVELLVPSINHESSDPNKSAVSAAAPPHPIADVPSSSGTAAGFVPTVDLPVPVPELITSSVFAPANIPTSSLTNIPVNVPTHVTPPVDAAASEPLDIDKLREEKLLQELDEMGFRQVDLNKDILRQNRYNLEQSVDDLCGVNEWDPLLAELHEMGFHDTETNKELLAQNGGSIKRAVMDLISREKDR